MRPRGVSGVFRARAWLTLQLYRAGREGRLAWASPQAFALLEAPADEAVAGGSRWLRALDRWWDVLVFTAAPVLLLGAAALLAVVWGTTPAVAAALACVLAAMAYVLVILVSVTVRGLLWLHRTLIQGRPREAADFGIGQLRASLWTVTLLHLQDAGRVGAVVDTVLRARPGDLLCPANGVTTERTRTALRAHPAVRELTADPPVLLIRPDASAPVAEPDNESPRASRDALRGIPLLLVAMAVVVGVNALFVADWERQGCGADDAGPAPASCDDRPHTYGDALYWLLNRLSGGDPEGLGAQTLQARSIGLAVTLMSVVVIGWVVTTLLQQAVGRTQRFGTDLTREFNAGLAAEPAPAVVPAPPPRPAASGLPVAAGFVAGMAVAAWALRRRARPDHRPPPSAGILRK